jgi:MFS transporter, DHA1 family, solute carrier family 18 (vesicular amine transporter), member 1/2
MQKISNESFPQISYFFQLYPEDSRRSKVMGIVLGSVALGVLIGYPAGGFLYDFVSESAPFIIISFFLFIDLFLQLTFFDFSNREVYFLLNLKIL